jgi:hypothetical protein
VDDIFWCAEISQKNVEFANVLGVRQRCARSDERRQNFWEMWAHKALSNMHDVFLFFVLCSNECDERCGKSFLSTYLLLL